MIPALVFIHEGTGRARKGHVPTSCFLPALTQDSGRVTAAAEAAHPESRREHVRNTAMASAGGGGGALHNLMKPIR